MNALAETKSPRKPTPQPSARRYIKPQTAALESDVSLSTIYNWMNAGILQSVKIGRNRLILMSSFEALADRASA